ncbi:MAG: hypothetical protein E6708_34790, partial [Bradyrhizobium sp.]|nr:hypothetical protein [Bradyrhizobium sp.]
MTRATSGRRRNSAAASQLTESVPTRTMANFTAAGQAVHDGKPLPEALLRGLHQMKHYGGAELGDRTLIDALQP